MRITFLSAIFIHLTFIISIFVTISIFKYNLIDFKITYYINNRCVYKNESERLKTESSTIFWHQTGLIFFSFILIHSLWISGIRMLLPRKLLLKLFWVNQWLTAWSLWNASWKGFSVDNFFKLYFGELFSPWVGTKR